MSSRPKNMFKRARGLDKGGTSRDLTISPSVFFFSSEGTLKWQLTHPSLFFYSFLFSSSCTFNNKPNKIYLFIFNL
ncbi:hypothetical protein OIU77_031165, partial [Salix suchowensis]